MNQETKKKSAAKAAFDLIEPNLNKDIVLGIGTGSTTNYFIDELNTQNTLDKNQLIFLKKHHNIKKQEITNIIIKTKKLMSILDKYKFYNIDFMNLDIEGHELEVLKSINFKKTKIKYMCIEMINYNKKAIENGKKIKSLLIKNNYILVKKIGFNFIYKKKK